MGTFRLRQPAKYGKQRNFDAFWRSGAVSFSDISFVLPLKHATTPEEITSFAWNQFTNWRRGCCRLVATFFIDSRPHSRAGVMDPFFHRQLEDRLVAVSQKLGNLRTPNFIDDHIHVSII